MATQKYRTTFQDGSTLEGDFRSADEAKTAHRNERIRAIDPSGTRPRTDVFTHGSVKVVKVEAVADADASAGRYRAADAPPGSPAGTGGRGRGESREEFERDRAGQTGEELAAARRAEEDRNRGGDRR